MLSAAAAAPAAAAAGPAATGLPSIRPGHVLFDAGIHSGVTRAQADAAALSASTFKQFKATVKVGTKSYTYVMAGKNPAKKVSRASAKIHVDLVPLVMKFSNGDTWNPAKKDSCDSGGSALTRFQQSPLEVSRAWKFGGTSIGSGQLTDAYQRADFWKYAKPKGINPSYGVKLAWKTLSPVTVHVPNADAATGTISCGSGLQGAAEINWLDHHIQAKVIPSLRSKGVGPSVVPIFLLHNFVEYITSTSNCCVLGYHNAYNVSGGVQTYGLGEYDNGGFFGSAVSDISTLTHEVGEWQNDPYTTNPTPKWGNIGQVAGCQANLEVGDPLSGTNFKVKVGTFTYHPQELAFFSWFYHQKPSLGVNGWYSDQGTFKKVAAKCR